MDVYQYYMIRKNYQKQRTSPFHNIPDSKVHVANVGPTWGRQDPGVPHVGSMNSAILDNP